MQNPRGDKAGCNSELEAEKKKKLEKEKLAFSKKRSSSSVVTGGKAERIGTDAGRFVDSVIGRWGVLT